VSAVPDPPLVGRALELRTIAESRAAGGVGFVLAGPSGVGKTRLARAALAEAGQADAAPLWVQATRSAAAIPLGALAGVLSDRIGSDDPLTVLRTSAQALTEKAGRRQLVLGVDDAQHLDQTSAALVLHLARTSAAFIVVTVRTGEPCPDAILALSKDAGAERLGLGALDEPQTEQLLEAVVGGSVEGGARQWIWELSRGNALYVTELVHGLLADGVLSCRDGLWRLSGPPRVPTSLAELVSARINSLADGVRRSLELLAVGEPLRLSELTRLESVDSLVSAESERLITVDETMTDPVLRLAHPLYGEAIQAALPALRARQLRLRLAESLRQDASTLTPEASLRVARWLLEIGEPVPPALLGDAAQAAIATGDPELGGVLAERAVEAGAGIEAQLLLGRSLAARNRFDEAAAALAGAEPMIGTPDEAIAYLQQQTAVLYWGLHRMADLRALLERASTWWPEISWQRRLDPLRDLITAHLLRDGTGIGGRPSSTLSDATDSDPQRQRAVQTAQLRRLTYEGRGRDAYRLAHALRPSVPFRDVYDQGASALWVSVCVQMGEDWDELEQWCQETMHEAVRREDHSAAGVSALGLGTLRYGKGRFREATRWLAEAQLHYERQDPLGLLVITSAYQSAVACATGDREAAHAALDRCRAAVRGDPPPPNQLPHLRWAEAWTAVADGEPARGWPIVLDVAAELASPSDVAFVGYEALRMGAPASSVAPLLADADARSDGPLITAAAAHALGSLGGDGAMLLDAADQFETIGALRYACEAAADAARSFLAEGQEGSARRAAAHSRRLFAEDEGGRLPSVDGLAGAPTVLSAREAELAALAAQGLSNAEIAARLVLSVRTVETYLYRAMQKLGLTDRRDLASVVGSASAPRRIAS
jgi:DNA-binding CsgD family transcriptional regulator